jgi:hypothetical protein
MRIAEVAMNILSSMTRLGVLALGLICAGCAAMEGKPGPGNQPTWDNGILGNGRSVEENRKVGSPGSD